MRRRIFLVLGLIFMSGCTGLLDREERRYRIAKWWESLQEGNGSTGGYQAQSDVEKARHERTVINELNSLVGNSPNHR
ncbi:hypothetical protein [Aquisphaera insulae]|uniref:hypothetical protein n=1 Tax=Aquisphaera insulae TaxID=2712864 RepID=UPI0013EB8A73|nr:hypothetical protein [Aquisphaera insulae]